jgi:preprotein translocase subunit YajC
MEIDYFIIVPILVAAIALLVFVIIRNQKDEKKFEEDMNKDTGDPERHPEDKI